jgi:hypothetical protein
MLFKTILMSLISVFFVAGAVDYLFRRQFRVCAVDFEALSGDRKGHAEYSRHDLSGSRPCRDFFGLSLYRFTAFSALTRLCSRRPFWRRTRAAIDSDSSGLRPVSRSLGGNGGLRPYGSAFSFNISRQPRFNRQVTAQVLFTRSLIRTYAARSDASQEGDKAGCQ